MTRENEKAENSMIKYRKANLNDIQYLVQYRKQQLADEGEALNIDINSELSNYFISSLSDGSLISWLALDGEKIVATSGLCFYQLPPNYFNLTGRVAYVTNMYTLPNYRKRGIASRLLQFIIDEAKIQEYKVIRLHASSEGRPVYSKAGFNDSNGHMALFL